MPGAGFALTKDDKYALFDENGVLSGWIDAASIDWDDVTASRLFTGINHLVEGDSFTVRVLPVSGRDCGVELERGAGDLSRAFTGGIPRPSAGLRLRVAGTAVEEMESGTWDLTLFTCTLGGQTRITVRCDLLENDMAAGHI